MNRSLTTLLLTGLAFATCPGWAADTLPMKKQGFFHAQNTDGCWWLIAPDGSRFISKGVTTVQFAQDHIQGTSISPYEDTNKAKYGGQQAWREAVARRVLVPRQ